MTVERATHFQNDLRKLFEKYGVESGFAFFMHNETLHPVEAHVTRANPFIVAMMDVFTKAAQEGTNAEIIQFVNNAGG